MKVVVFGCYGVLGSAVARHLDCSPAVEQVVCVGRDAGRVQRLVSSLERAVASPFDATDGDAVRRVSVGCGLVVNALPITLNTRLMSAALDAGASYIDFAGPMEEGGRDFVERYRWLFSEWSDRFRAKGLLALVGCGVTPGLFNVLARDSVEKLVRCDTIELFRCDTWCTRDFVPFWTPPHGPIADMETSAFRFEGGRFVLDAPFSRSHMTELRGVGKVCWPLCFGQKGYICWFL